MLEMKNRLGSMEDQQQALENENTLLRARIQSVTPASDDHRILSNGSTQASVCVCGRQIALYR